MKILISGGGLGGLTAAICLLKDGHDVEVFEQAPELGEIGAGIQLSANASRVLIDLGLKDELDKLAVRPLRIEFKLHDTAEVISTVPLGADHEGKFGAPYYQMYRPDLHKILENKVRSLAPEAVKLNASAISYAEHDDRVDLRLGDGAIVSGDLLIGADGIKSVVRKQMHGAEPPNFTGQVAWRGVIPKSRLPKDFMPPVFANWMGPSMHMIIYWVRGGDYLNFVGCVAKPEWTAEGWTVKAPWEDLKADFAGFHDDVQTMIDLADPDACYCWALNNRPKLSHWSSDRVTLLGDSAHPTIPYMAQGAVMAIEDGAVLARALKNVTPLPKALKAYENARLDRTARIVNESTEHAKLYQRKSHDDFRAAFQEKRPADDRAKWLYNYDPLTTPIDSLG